MKPLDSYRDVEETQTQDLMPLCDALIPALENILDKEERDDLISELAVVVINGRLGEMENKPVELAHLFGLESFSLLNALQPFISQSTYDYSCEASTKLENLIEQAQQDATIYNEQAA